MQGVFVRRIEDARDLVESIKSMIDHTNLRPEASVAELERTCRETLEYGFYACCIPPFFVEKARRIVGERARVVTVVGFPHGNVPTEVKEREVREAFESGADEVDAVINISLLRSGMTSEAVEEAKRLLEVVKEHGGVLKVIIETGFLDASTIYNVSRELSRIGVHFVKTSTGFGPRGATPEDIIVIRRAVSGTSTRIKAAGGIRTGLQALYFYLLGADRIGTSSSTQIVSDIQRISTNNV
ncbi:deoxyribose-phosphate aldolase [Infirmifilum lucidum]|uniref:Deoxyribose-phosphate aldolase n=1 Tax=Infirmifilum lucidum TaxID=2776706 RepID=A0A7L9FIA5_9CREN|nr:deoxyribose-phosphate aldolase [Infirmifilum lucidum]QOJ79568.1 deoxyribose-phosphate aldolase [Infirmifilum lucidum]